MSNVIELKARDNCMTPSTPLSDIWFCQLLLYLDNYLDNVLVLGNFS